jgi:hypothetical protein
MIGQATSPARCALRLQAAARACLVLMLGALPLAGEAPAQASASLYNVEVVVFRMNGPREGEPGAAPLRSAAGESSADSSAGVAQAARFVGALPAAKLQLSGNRQKLAAAGYRILAHTGWTQTASSWGSRSGLPIARLGVQAAGLSGEFLLERGALLHLGMNLTYVTENGVTHQLSEIRRVRFNEKNYYDHPGLAVIAVVTPAGR